MKGFKTGCLIVAGLGVIVLATLGYLIGDFQKNPPSKADYNQLSVIKGVTDEQRQKISDILKECEITSLKSVTYDKSLEGYFTYSDKNKTPRGTEDAYRIDTVSAQNVILYVKDGQVLGIRYVSNVLYENGKCILKLSQVK